MGRACVSPVDPWFAQFPAGLVFLSEFVSGTLSSEVPRADRDGAEKLPGSERSATFHTPYHDVNR